MTVVMVSTCVQAVVTIQQGHFAIGVYGNNKLRYVSTGSNKVLHSPSVPPSLTLWSAVEVPREYHSLHHLQRGTACYTFVFVIAILEAGSGALLCLLRIVGTLCEEKGLAVLAVEVLATREGPIEEQRFVVRCSVCV